MFSTSYLALFVFICIVVTQATEAAKTLQRTETCQAFRRCVTLHAASPGSRLAGVNCSCRTCAQGATTIVLSLAHLATNTEARGVLNKRKAVTWASPKELRHGIESKVCLELFPEY